MGYNRLGKSAQKPRKNQLLLCPEDFRRQCAAILRPAGTRRKSVSPPARVRPKRTRIRRVPPQRHRGLQQAAITRIPGAFLQPGTNENART